MHNVFQKFVCGLILVTLTACSTGTPHGDIYKFISIPELNLRINIPSKFHYSLNKRNDQTNIRIGKEFVKNETKYILGGIEIESVDEINKKLVHCEEEVGQGCGINYPLLQQQYAAKGSDHIILGDYDFLIITEGCGDDICMRRKYITFIKDYLVTTSVLIYFDLNDGINSAYYEEADKIINQISFEKDNK